MSLRIWYNYNMFTEIHDRDCHDDNIRVHGVHAWHEGAKRKKRCIHVLNANAHNDARFLRKRAKEVLKCKKQIFRAGWIHAKEGKGMK